MRASGANTASKRGSLRMIVPSVGPPACPEPVRQQGMQQSLLAQAVRVINVRAKMRVVFMGGSPSIDDYYTQPHSERLEIGSLLSAGPTLLSELEHPPPPACWHRDCCFFVSELRRDTMS